MVEHNPYDQFYDLVNQLPMFPSPYIFIEFRGARCFKQGKIKLPSINSFWDVYDTPGKA